MRERAGLDPDRLALMHERQVLTHGGSSWSILVIRRGWLAGEWHTFNILVPSRFDIWSCTKSLTGTAWGVLIGDGREGRAQGGRRVDLDTPAYGLIPAGHPLTDPRKARITLGHLLTMTSGLPGEETGVIGMPTAADVGPFEHALGRARTASAARSPRSPPSPGRAGTIATPASRTWRSPSARRRGATSTPSSRSACCARSASRA